MPEELNDNRRYVDYRLDDLKRGQDHQAGVLEGVVAKLAEIETELRAYKRAAQLLMALGTFLGAVLGWFAKALGKA